MSDSDRQKPEIKSLLARCGFFNPSGEWELFFEERRLQSSRGDSQGASGRGHQTRDTL